MKLFLRDLLNVPNTISLVRLVVTPLMPLLWFGFDMPAVALAIGTVAGLTDLFDGILARKLNQITELGALIDQLGDLLFESTGLLIGVMLGELWAGWLILYLFREFTVTVVRTYVISNGGKLPSSWLGKAKSSLLQYAFFPYFLGNIFVMPGVLPGHWQMAGISPGRLLMWMGSASFIAGLSIGVLSGWQYLKAFAQFYINRINEQDANAN